MKGQKEGYSQPAGENIKRHVHRVEESKVTHFLQVGLYKEHEWRVEAGEEDYSQTVGRNREGT